MLLLTHPGLARQTDDHSPDLTDPIYPPALCARARYDLHEPDVP